MNETKPATAAPAPAAPKAPAARPAAGPEQTGLYSAPPNSCNARASSRSC